MNYLLIKFTADWADEHDVFGFRLFTKDAWEAYKADALDIFRKYGVIDWGFGTNQGIEFTAASWLNSLDEVPIDTQQHDTLLLLFGKQFGEFPEIVEPEI